MTRTKKTLPPVIAKKFALRVRSGKIFKWVPRVCEQCFYSGSRAWPGCQHGDAREVKKFFGIALCRAMPAVIDGQEVGHRCPFYCGYDLE